MINLGRKDQSGRSKESERLSESHQPSVGTKREWHIAPPAYRSVINKDVDIKGDGGKD